MARSFSRAARGFALALFAFSAAAQDTPTFSTNVNLVLLNATVRGKNGAFARGLDKDDFAVYEDGVQQTIRVFQHRDAPAAIGLVVDHSGSMGPKRQDVNAAAMAFVHSSNPLDQMFVVDFNEHVRFGLPETEPFTSDPAALEAAFHAPDTGRTALYDAIVAALGQLQRATLERKALIVISDGGDNASRHTLDQTVDAAAHSDALIYTIGIFDEHDEHPNPGALRKLAHATGGEAFLPDTAAEVTPICLRIAEEIRNQYTIGYVPSDPNTNRGYRRIHVTARGPHGEKYVVRTRTGYVAGPEASDSRSRDR